MKAFAALCDDLTGSSVQAILLKERGLPVRQVIRPEGGIKPPAPGEVLSVNCDTRRLSPQEAEAVISRLLSILPPDVAVGKRVDTTLRGHLLLETSTILAARPRAAALVVPAYPPSGRITVGGYHLLDGSLLERTEAARDPLWPIRSSYVPGYFGEALPCGQLPMETVKLGPKAAASALSEILSGGVRVIACDAMTMEDIENIAGAAASLPFEIIPVDPGPFTAAFVARKLGAPPSRAVLAVIGSASAKTAGQIAWAEARLKCAAFTLTPGESLEDALPKLKSFIEGLGGDEDFVLIRPSRQVVAGAEEATSASLAALGLEALHSLGDRVCGILLSGGDTAAVFFEAADASSLAPLEEIQPLIMGGRILDGELAGFPVVTKGGLIGGEDGIFRAVRWLKKERN
ncbi:MAG: four-carbon acid sugar kinase family protein [Synergistaceae bacterium]|nr:four-carbon acid sugar kinase family protein [Synergistaceae bacterium]